MTRAARTGWTARGATAPVVAACSVVVVAGLSGCASAGDLELQNAGPEDVVVVVDGEDVEVPGGGGALLLENGCTDDDVVVRRASGEETVLRGPVCPPDLVFVGETVAEVRETVAATG